MGVFFKSFIGLEQVKNANPEGPALVSPHKGAVKIPLLLFGIMEYWNTGKFGGNRNATNNRISKKGTYIL
jgi:hypothetical protein